MASDAVLAVQQVLNQQNGHHPPLPPVTSSPPQLSQPTVTQPPQVPPLPPSKRQAPLDSTTTTDPDDSVSLSSLSQPASSHSQKSLLNKSAVVSFFYVTAGVPRLCGLKYCIRRFIAIEDLNFPLE